MSQHDFDIANALFPATRSDINNALAALGSLSSGAAAPGSPIAHQLWADTAVSKLKKRNTGNTAWVDLLPINAALTFFVVWIQNIAGALNHNVTSVLPGTVLPGWVSAFNGFSVSANPTPTVDAVTPFTAGVGIASTSTHSLILDSLAAQDAGKIALTASIIWNGTGNAVVAHPGIVSQDVNGVTLARPAISFLDAVAATVFVLNTTNIPAGKAIGVQVMGFVEVE